MILGIGIDIVDVDRFKGALKRWGTAFTNRLFTEDELSYCLTKKRPEEHLAARFAAKEAFFKAIGKSEGITSFIDVSVFRAKDGKPVLKVPALSDSTRLHLSISHDGASCVAQVVAEEGHALQGQVKL
jgi:holo-[acyl-carrier protein] synthase